MTDTNEPNLIAESRRLCGQLSDRLPSDFALNKDAWFISPSGNANAVASKLPSKVMSVVGSSAHRAKDFGELSCQLFRSARFIHTLNSILKIAA